MPEGTLRAILKQAGIDADTFLQKIASGVAAATIPGLMLTFVGFPHHARPAKKNDRTSNGHHTDQTSSVPQLPSGPAGANQHS